MRINHNMMALNAQNNLGLVNTKKVRSTEKLSSGYRINRAADDAAGLAISEKMRRLIRGLDQGTENAVDGVSWTQIGDGSLNEASDILHRMTELSVKAQNETNTAEDRMYMELEFEQLQTELDRIGTTTTFNEMPIFDEHEVPYYQCEGAQRWDPQQKHTVMVGLNDLTFRYAAKEGDPLSTMTITVPPGEYTTQELVDEIETELAKQNTGDERIELEFTGNGYCNANLEGGEKIDSVYGGLSYLIYDIYRGGGYGALIGTTIFSGDYPLEIVTGKNDFMSFSIEDFSGASMQKNITLPQGFFNRTQLIDMINAQLTDTTVKASAYGTGIKLASDEAIVTGFKGNMFQIDEIKPAYDSVFYDNVKYGSVTQTAATFTGGYVLPTDARDEEHKYYEIDSSNNTLILQPNGSDSSVTITIPDGKYTAAQMAAQLNNQFAAEGLALTAERIYNNGFEGIRITSGVKGLVSQVGIDPSSGAYDTLFVKRQYNAYSTVVNPVNETTANREAVFRASRDLSSLAADPLTITAGVNDSFKLTINGTAYTITMTAKTYTSVQDVVNELNAQLNGASAPLGYKDCLKVEASAGKIVLTGQAGKNINTIRVTADGANQGYDRIFQGYNVTTAYPTASGTGSVTLNTPYDGTVDAAESSMDITVNGTKHTVTLPTGNVSQDQIKNTIETAIPPQTQTKDNTFTTISAQGTNQNLNFNGTSSGTTSSPYWGQTATGVTEKQEGSVAPTRNDPAVLTIGIPLANNMKVDTFNNAIALTLNNVTKTITLDSGTYSQTSLVSALQAKIDAEFGTGMGGAIVSLNGNKLQLTSRLPMGSLASATNISCSTTNSSFLKELNTTRTPAVYTSQRQLPASVTIGAGQQDMKFTYAAGGTSQEITLTLTQGTYTQGQLITEINTQLAKTGTGITASLNSGKLVLTSAEKGNGVSISYATASAGGSAEAMFGPLSVLHPAQKTVNLNTQASITIEAGNSDQFTINVNGTDKTVTLDAGTYVRTDFLTMLNSKLAGTGVSAYLDGGTKLGYKTDAVGTGASLSMSYANGGSSMKAIYGETTTTIPGVTVSFDANGYMSLATTTGTGNISVGSANGGAFQQPIVNRTPIATGYTDGYHSAKKSYIDGVNLTGDVTIDEWNDELKFTFRDNGADKQIAVEVPDGTYTYADLQTKLQELLDNAAGSGKISVSVSATGVRLESTAAGNQYQFSGFGGDFYHKVICKAVETTTTQAAVNKDGQQRVNSAYTVGRKDVRSNPVEIRAGISDEFSLDLTYGGTLHTLSVTLDPGIYNSTSLVTHLQTKLNEQLHAIGLEDNLIEVGVGGINTGVYGANDSNALNFKLSGAVQAPVGGQFIIDGVRGNAAFEIFYQTDGKLEPAYIRGSKDVSKGVTIPPNETDLSIRIDGTLYNLTIPAGDYTKEQLLTTINDGLDAAGAPAVAELDDGTVKIIHKKMGTHTMDEISGEAKSHVLFNEEGEDEEGPSRYVKLSSVDGDNIGLKHHRFNTAALGINSCCISQVKNAEKALNRIKTALERVSTIRSDFGSTQNRLEHAINNNENAAENLQSAESVIRDTDMAKEMVAFSNHQILAQAGEAVLAQANQSQQGILALLNG